MNPAVKALGDVRASDAKRWKTPAERARLLGLRGLRLPTGFATLDQAMRGGPLAGRVIVVGGAPGAGKTSLLVQLAHHYAAQGSFVAILAADEDANGLLVRWGQLDGLSREALEAGDEDARRMLETNVAAQPFILVDADEEGATVEDVAEELARRAGNQPAILFVDSMQRARARVASENASPRERIDAVMAALCLAAKTHAILVVATSEVSRGSYNGGQWHVNDLAAFKESGGIEYGASVALLVRSSPLGPNLFEVGIPKNRLGSKPTLWLVFDPERATFEEVDAPTSHQRGATGDPLARSRERVLSTLANGKAFATKTALAKACGGSKARTLEAIAAFVGEGVIEQNDDGLRLAPSNTAPVPVLGSPLQGRNQKP